MQSDDPIIERPSRSCRGTSRSAGEVGGVSAGGLATQGCARACWAVILLDGSVVSSLEMKSLAGGHQYKGGWRGEPKEGMVGQEKGNETYKNKNKNKIKKQNKKTNLSVIQFWS